MVSNQLFADALLPDIQSRDFKKWSYLGRFPKPWIFGSPGSPGPGPIGTWKVWLLGFSFCLSEKFFDQPSLWLLICDQEIWNLERKIVSPNQIDILRAVQGAIDFKFWMGRDSRRTGYPIDWNCPEIDFGCHPIVSMGVYCGE